MIRNCILTGALCSAVAFGPLGCGETLGRIGSYRFGEDVTQDSQARENGLWDEETREDTDTQDVDSQVEAEQERLEDPGALSALISSKLSALERHEESTESPYLDAVGNWKLGAEQCRSKLEESNLSYSRPDFQTPLVDSPLLVDGRFGKVQVVPRWPRDVPLNEVVDCHLALALSEMSRVAARLGIARLEYYSTYRPLRVPKGNCPAGRVGSKCRGKKREHQLLKKNGGGSQHRRALAIDIRWVVLEDGRRLDVLEHYDRRDGTPPCDYEAEGEDARLLQKFVCEVYDARLFNVMLTPNANKAHHNHLHFDLTPGADWYILR